MGTSAIKVPENFPKMTKEELIEFFTKTVGFQHTNRELMQAYIEHFHPEKVDDFFGAAFEVKDDGKEVYKNGAARKWFYETFDYLRITPSSDKTSKGAAEMKKWREQMKKKAAAQANNEN